MQGYNLVPLILLIVLFYFMIIRPQQQRQKRHRELIESLVEKDRVVTIGGIVGTVAKIKDNTVILQVGDNVKIEVLKSAISYKYEEKLEEKKPESAKEE